MPSTEGRVREILTEMQAANKAKFVAELKIEYAMKEDFLATIGGRFGEVLQKHLEAANDLSANLVAAARQCAADVEVARQRCDANVSNLNTTVAGAQEQLAQVEVQHQIVQA